MLLRKEVSCLARGFEKPAAYCINQMQNACAACTWLDCILVEQSHKVLTRMHRKECDARYAVGARTGFVSLAIGSIYDERSHKEA
jgi:hypothetical protein